MKFVLLISSCLDLLTASSSKGTKFEVAYDSMNKVRNNEATPLPQPDGVGYGSEIAQWVTAYMSHVIVNDGIKLPRENRLNYLFPDIQPVSMRELLTKAWKTS